MKFSSSYISFIFSLILLFSAPAFSQSRQELEKKKKQNQKDIEYTNKLLEETKKNSDDSYNNLIILNKKISLRKELIDNMAKEIKLLDNKIGDNKMVIGMLENDLKKLKEKYAKLILYAYKHRSNYDRLMFILASEDFNQAYKRLKYLQQYSMFRQKQAQAIIETQKALAGKIKDLEVQKNEKKELLKKQQEETIVMNLEKTQQNELFNKLKSKESDLKKKLTKQLETAKQLEKEIEKIIAEEARKAAERAKKNSTTKPTSSGMFDLTPEEKIISDKFEANKGVLPWPTERGIVTSPFGEHPHPIISNVMVVNNGIDISTTEGSTVRVIFDGEVSKVVNIPGANKAVLIRHGNFFTLYSNLKDVTVKAGDKVTTKQSIGTVFTDSGDGNKTTLHFEIWMESTKQNPSNWLSKKQ